MTSFVEHPDTSHDGSAARVRAVGGHAALTLLAVGVLALGIAVNTVLFRAVGGLTQTSAASSMVSSVLGVGAGLLLLGCAGLSAVVICAGPRWLRRRSLG